MPDAVRLERLDLAEGYRRRALISGLLVGAVALGGLAILHADAPRLYTGLTHRALPLVISSAVMGLLSLALLVLRRYVLVRVSAALAVTAILWGWAVAQYPYLLPPDTTYTAVAATGSVLTATLVVSGVGALVLFPSLAWLLILFQRQPAQAPSSQDTGRRGRPSPE